MTVLCTVLFSCEDDESISCSVTAFAGYGGVSAVADRENAVEGEIVTVTATPDAGFLFKEWKVRVGDAVIADVATNPATFIMPAGKVVVVAAFMIKDDIIDKMTDPAFKSYCQYRMNQSQEIDGRTYDKWDTNGDGMLSEAEAAMIEAIDLTGGFEGVKVKNIETMEFFTALKVLRVGENELTELDLTNGGKLTHLDCSGNALSDLDLSICKGLSMLDCSANKLTKVKITECKELVELYCNNNHLTELSAGTMNFADGYILHCGNQTTPDGALQTLTLKLNEDQKEEWNTTLKELEENANVEVKGSIIGNVDAFLNFVYVNAEKGYGYTGITFETKNYNEQLYIELSTKDFVAGEYDKTVIDLEYTYLLFEGKWWEDGEDTFISSANLDVQYDENSKTYKIEGILELSDGRIVGFTYEGAIYF